MKKFSIITALVAGLVALAAPAYAGGSDDPTPYIVSEDGIYLPHPDTFEDGEHINIRTTTGKTYNLHFEARNWPETHPKRYYIGKSSIPWSAFDKNPFCVEWVQISGYNEHYGEGGQSPVGPGCTKPTPSPTPEPTPTLPPLPADEVKVETGKPVVDCDTKVGDTVKVTRTTTTTRYSYDPYGKPVGTSSTFTEQVDYVIEAPDLFDLVCETPTPTPTSTQPPLPDTGGTSEGVLWAAGIGVLALAGGLLIRRKKVEA